MDRVRDRLAEAVAKGLRIKESVRAQQDGPFKIIGLDWRFVEVPKETSVQFKKVLKKDLTDRIRRTNVGETFEYSFDFTNVKGYNNLQQILDQLPILPENQSYYFSKDMVLSIKVLRRDDNTTDVEVVEISQWIERAYYFD